jgi:hypothetical protein
MELKPLKNNIKNYNETTKGNKKYSRGECKNLIHQIKKRGKSRQLRYHAVTI